MTSIKEGNRKSSTRSAAERAEERHSKYEARREEEIEAARALREANKTGEYANPTEDTETLPTYEKLAEVQQNFIDNEPDSESTVLSLSTDEDEDEGDFE